MLRCARLAPLASVAFAACVTVAAGCALDGSGTLEYFAASQMRDAAVSSDPVGSDVALEDATAPDAAVGPDLTEDFDADIRFDAESVDAALPVPSALAWTTGKTSARFNKPNGLGLFSDACPDGQVLVGADGRAGADFQWIRGACAPVSVVAASDGSYRVSVSNVVTLLPQRGPNDSLTFSVRCPTDTAAVGISGQAATSGFGGVSQLNFTCASLIISKKGTSFGLGRGPTSTVSASGTRADTPFSYAAEGVNLLTGLSGRAVTGVEAIGTFDRQPALTYR